MVWSTSSYPAIIRVTTLSSMASRCTCSNALMREKSRWTARSERSMAERSRRALPNGHIPRIHTIMVTGSDKVATGRRTQAILFRRELRVIAVSPVPATVCSRGRHFVAGPRSGPSARTPRRRPALTVRVAVVEQQPAVGDDRVGLRTARIADEHAQVFRHLGHRFGQRPGTALRRRRRRRCPTGSRAAAVGRPRRRRSRTRRSRSRPR